MNFDEIPREVLKINDTNSILEVYLEYLHTNLKDGIAFEVIGFFPIDPNFKIYIICNKAFRFVICGTDLKRLQDKRFKNPYKLLKKSTFFSYPKDIDLQIFDKYQYKDVASKIFDELNYKNENEFYYSNDPNKILAYFKSDP